MFTNSDYDKLQQIMAQNPENKALIQKLLDSQKETISTISHEIRNPLTLVYSTLQLIESQHPEIQNFRHWDSLRDDIEYMKQLLEELSVFNNGSTLSCSPFDFRKFMQQLAVSFAISMEEREIEFTSYIDPELPVICADRIKLKEVFLNLLKNGADAVSPDAITNKTVRLEAHFDKKQILVRVQDNGCGIEKCLLPDIFTPFVTHKEGGTGLGLSIVKRSVEAHGGQVTVRSSKGLGTVFEVTLPV